MTPREAYHAWQLMSFYDRMAVIEGTALYVMVHRTLAKFVRQRDSAIVEFVPDTIKFIGRVIRGRAAETQHRERGDAFSTSRAMKEAKRGAAGNSWTSS